MILIIDFGSQTTHLIARRIKDLGAAVSIIEPELAMKSISAHKPKGIVLSGGPASVYSQSAPTVDAEIFSLGIPILAICYGQQLTAQLLGGVVKPGDIKEYGPATLVINRPTKLFASVSQHSRIWMSHGDLVQTPPSDFTFVAETENIKAASMVNESKNIYCIQFHPEVEHTEHGTIILKNFLEICQVSYKTIKFDVNGLISKIKNQIGDGKALAAVSGGLDSTLASTLVVKAISNNLIPVHIESGLMRAGTTEKVKSYFENILHIPIIVVDAKFRFLHALKGITDPELKRQIIGKLYVNLFEEVLNDHQDVKYLVQGTIYSDIIESKGSRHADKIKSHHNVGGLPENMKLSLVEPLKELYTDEVRKISAEIGIPDEFINEQPHPGPGYAIRIIGEINQSRLDTVTQADNIIIEEMKKNGWYHKLLHSFAVLTDTKSTAVKGDGRVYGSVIVLRCITSKDRMTAAVPELPYIILSKISSRIVNEIPNVSRVVYDITTKPPATMEWE